MYKHSLIKKIIKNKSFFKNEDFNLFVKNPTKKLEDLNNVLNKISDKFNFNQQEKIIGGFKNRKFSVIIIKKTNF